MPKILSMANGSPRSDEVWSHIDFEHPATFDTLAMHPDKKRRIKEDLDSFSRNKDYYRRIGKPWKRGYLLYGPPGTGKSSMIAAMANYLNYDIYDIELTTVDSNSDLRKLFIETTGKSIIVIEDIDCSLDNLTGQRSNQKKKSKGSAYSEHCCHFLSIIKMLQIVLTPSRWGHLTPIVV